MGGAILALFLGAASAAQSEESALALPLRPRTTQAIEPDSLMLGASDRALLRGMRGLPGPAAPAVASLPNILVNDPTDQPVYTGNTQTEPSIAASGDTLVCGFTDSGGFFGSGTVTGYALSFDRGQTWFDAGSLPRLGTGGTEMVLGDPTVVTDGRGLWYCLSVYDVGNGWAGPGSGDLGLVLQRGHFIGTSLQWSSPWLVAGGGVGDLLDAPHMAVDPERDRLYVTYSNLSVGYTFGQIEVLTIGGAGSALLHRCVVQPVVSQLNNYGSSLAVGPEGEVYCAWESGLLDGYGQGPAEQRIARSLDGGATFSAPVVAATVIESWCTGPPGYNREGYFVEFPSIAVDCSTGPYRGRVYLAWHDAVLRDFSGSLLFVNEAAGNNDSPQVAQVLPSTASQWQVVGGFTSSDWSDWYRFSGAAGEHVRGWLEPNSAMQIGLQLRCGSGPSGALADTVLASSLRRMSDIVWFLFTLPRDGDYSMQVSRHNSYTGTYTCYLRKTTVTTPGPAVDHRDIVVVSSPDGIDNWTPLPVRVNDDTGAADQAFPAVVVDGAGGVHVSWYDRRFDPRWRAGADFVMASSFDGGTTFTPNVRVTSATSFWQVPSDMIPNFGDVQRPVADGDHIYLVWTDGRFDEPDVMTAPLRADFTLTAPASVRSHVGETLGLAVTLRNDTPHSGADFSVHIHSPVPELADTTLVLSALGSGDEATVSYDPYIDAWIRQYGAFDLSLRVTSTRSAYVDTQTVRIVNDQVDVPLTAMSLQRTAQGIELSWQCTLAARFDVERAPREEGPYLRLTAERLAPVDGNRFVYVDGTAPAAAKCAYRLIAHEANGGSQVLGPWLGPEAGTPTAHRVALLGAEPNTFNPATTLRFELPTAARVSLRILDVRGREVATLLDAAPYPAGQHTVRWDSSQGGRPASSGVYVAELSALGRRVTRRVVLLR